MTAWYRTGCFSGPPTQSRVGYFYISDKIEYVKRMVLAIEREQNDVHHAYLHLDPSPFYTNEMFDIVKKIFPQVDSKVQVNLGYGMIRIKLDTNALRFLSEFVQYNDKLRCQFSPKIVSEITAFYWYAMSGKEFQHHIQEYEPVNESHSNPALDDSKQLIYYFNDHWRNEATTLLIKAIHALLIRGENPNQKDKWYSFLTRVIVLLDDNLYIIKLLMHYGCRFDRSDHPNTMTPIEYALEVKKFHIVDMFITAMTRLQKTIPPAHQSTACSFHADKNKIISCFQFPAGEIYTTLKRSIDVTPEEMSGLNRVYPLFFNGKKARKITLKPEDNKLVDIIRHESGKIMGMVIYKIRFVKNDLWVNIDIALSDSQYMNFGIMPIVIFRFPYSLQPLFPKTRIRVVFFAAHPDAYKTASGSPHVPKEQPEGRVDETFEILKNEFNYKLTLIHPELSVCYVVEENPVKVKGDYRSKHPDMEEELYQQFRGSNDGVDEETMKQRDVLVEFDVNDKHFARLCSLAAARKINFYCLTWEFSKKIKESELVPSLTMPAEPRFFKARELFWQNRQIEADISELKSAKLQPTYKSMTTAKL